MKSNDKKELFLNLEQAFEEYKKMPKPIYLWGGIKEKTMGLVFGPSKSGKTIFCENMAMAIAIGEKEYLGLKLSGVPKRVLFVGLEEHWTGRIERNKMQLTNLPEAKKNLAVANYLIQPFEFTKYLINSSQWKDFERMIKASKADVVFVDSITRMNHGILEESKTAEEIMQRLREIAYEIGITLVCIHHTPKILDKPLSLDKIKGSSVFAQEADFALGINRTSVGFRYQKDVFFRYASDDSIKVREFEITSNTTMNFVGMANEHELLNRSDGRRNNKNRDKILEFIQKNSCKKYTTQELIEELKQILGIKKRQIQQYLKELLAEGKLEKPKNGIYRSSLCVEIERKVGDEEE